MRLKLFTKDDRVCYSTGTTPVRDGKYLRSEFEERLISQGWIYAGMITSRDMAGLEGIVSATKELKR